jgi:hypothetical protein
MDLILAGSRPEISKENHLTIELKKQLFRTSAIQLFYRAMNFGIGSHLETRHQLYSQN